MTATRSYLEERRSARRWQAITGIVAAAALAAAALWALDSESESIAAALPLAAGSVTTLR